MRRQILNIGFAVLVAGVFGQPAFGAPIGESLGLRAARSTLNPIEEAQYFGINIIGTIITTAGMTSAGTAPAGMSVIMVRGSLAIGGADRLDGTAGGGVAPILPGHSMSVLPFGQALPAFARASRCRVCQGTDLWARLAAAEVNSASRPAVTAHDLLSPEEAVASAAAAPELAAVVEVAVATCGADIRLVPLPSINPQCGILFVPTQEAQKR